MALVIGLALAALCLGVVAMPFLQKRRGAPSEYTDPISELEQRRNGIYQEARTLHNDYVLGDVTLANYQERLQEYRLQAAQLLYQQERLQDLDQRLEAEILSHRSAAGLEGRTPACPECGSPTSIDTEQCSSCGAVLSGMAQEG